MSTILIAMFSPRTSSKIIFGLKNRDYTCLEASDPKTMQQFLSNNDIDLLLISINKREPALTNYIKALKESSKHSSLPIIVVMPKLSIGEVDAIFQTGADECISIPFKLANLLTKIDTIINEGIKPVETTNNAIPEILQNDFSRITTEGRQLADISEIYSGASVSDHKARRMSRPSSDWTEIIVNNAVEPFYLSSEREYFLMRKNLMRYLPKIDEYAVKEKVLIKRTINPLAAVLDTTGLPFTNELYGLQTVKGFSCATLACILNSRYSHFYFQRYRPPTDGLRGVYLSKADIQSLPIIIPEIKEQKILDKLYHELNVIKISTHNKDGSIERVKILNKINHHIFDIFGIKTDSVKLLNSLHF